MLKAVERHGGVLHYASEKLRNDKQVVLAAVREDGGALRFVTSETLKKDKDVVLPATLQQSRGIAALGVLLGH